MDGVELLVALQGGTEGAAPHDVIGEVPVGDAGIVLIPAGLQLRDEAGHRLVRVPCGGIGGAEGRADRPGFAGIAGNIARLQARMVRIAMDWLHGRQDDIEKQLAARHLAEGGIAMFDLSSSWVEGSHCELAACGYSRDGKRGKAQIEYGLLTDQAGRPVAVRVLAGNTARPKAFPEAVKAVRGTFAPEQMIMAGDRGMITSARIRDLRKLEGMAWITCLRHPAIKKLMAGDGPLQLSLFDEQDLAEISSPDFPGERLIACRNPFEAAKRARTRQELLAATEADLGAIAARAAAGRLKDPDKIGVAAGKVINKRKVARHFILDISEGRISGRRDQDSIDAEAATDGIYVIRTPVPAGTLDAAGAVAAYKDLANLERDFRHIKAEDPGLRPIWHRLEDRVKAHVLICMLACYLTWHLRRARAPLTFTDEH